MTTLAKTKEPKPARAEKSPRVKTKFTTDQCAHVWAQRTQERGETKGGILDFSYDVLTAYSTVIAILVTDKDGATRAIHRREVRCSGWAPNYGSIARGASRQYPAHYVESLQIFSHSWRSPNRLDCREESTKAKLQELLTGLVESFRATIAEMSNINKGKDWLDSNRRAERIRERLAGCIEFAEAFGLKVESMPLYDESEKACASIAESIAERDRKANAPETIAKREKASATKQKRAQRFDVEFKNWLKWGTKKPPYSAYAAEFSELKRDHVKRKLESDAQAFRWQERGNGFGYPAEYVPAYAWDFTRPLRTHAARVKSAKDTVSAVADYGFNGWCYRNEDFAKACPLAFENATENERSKWIAGLSRHSYEQKSPPPVKPSRYASTSVKRLTAEEWINGEGNASQYHFERTLVRRKGNRLETSRGAEAPFSQAVAIFLKAQQCARLRQGWKANGEQFEAGFFKLDSIDATGGINIGCHRIEYQEMLNLAVREIPERVAVNLPVAA